MSSKSSITLGNKSRHLIIFMTSLLLTIPQISYASVSKPTLEQSIAAFNKTIKGNIEADIYFNNKEYLIKEKYIKFNNLTLESFNLDKDFDLKPEKASTLYFNGKLFLASSSSLQKFSPKAGLALTPSELTDKSNPYYSILALDYFAPLRGKDYSIDIAHYKLINSSKGTITLQSVDGGYNLDLRLSSNGITSLDYYTVDGSVHNSFLVYKFKKNSSKIKYPLLTYTQSAKLTQELKGYISNYNLMKDVGVKMISSFLAVLVSSYINNPGIEISEAFTNLFNSLPESYSSYNPKSLVLPNGSPAVSFTLSDYEVCGYLELDQDKKITSQKIFIDSPCSL